MRPFSLLIKPASGDCNLNCTYCFYSEKCGLFPDTRRHRMSPKTLARLVTGYLRTPQPVHTFGWQGGEPTLMGQAFFEQVIQLQQQAGRAGASVANGLQTNAMLIDDEFAAFLARYNFLVGCSLDGPAELHDRYRRSVAGRGSHADVMRGIDCLRRQRAAFNILTLVSQTNVREAGAVYRYLCDAGFLYHQYIPCVEAQPDGTRQPFSISGPEWGDFLCTLFDAWYVHDTRRVSIRHFDAIVAKLVDNQATVCTLGRNCRQYFVVEYNGNVYPCDFFVEPELQLGNIMTDDWPVLLDSPAYRDFGARKAQWSPACNACEFLNLCAGDCLKHRTLGGQPPTHCSELCAGWQQFFRHTHARFAALAESIRLERRQAATAAVVPPHPTAPSAVGRNDPCPCGSGRKYKRCCGA